MPYIPPNKALTLRCSLRCSLFFSCYSIRLFFFTAPTLFVSTDQLLKRDVAKRRVFDFWRNRKGAISGSHSARAEAALSCCFFHLDRR